MDNKMRRLFLCFIFSFTSSLFALDGKWNFENIFSQTVMEGNVALNNLSVGIIRSLEFGNHVNNSRWLRNGFVELLESNDTYRRYPCTIFEADSVLVLGIRANKEISLKIFTAMDNNNQLWYSIPVLIDPLQWGEIRGTSETDTVFQNLMGIMRRVR
jgi:hypothetical protein